MELIETMHTRKALSAHARAGSASIPDGLKYAGGIC